ncbi:hypothetical protein H4S04_008451 [Coemansia sp. S16]|nr:hypothetical protein H4S04_008451 [Coemansia sp. S16]KAJ2050467.1 hypothetical protein GGH13_008772 [Coemansia sp. S155-1]
MTRIPVSQAPALLPKFNLHVRTNPQPGSDTYVYDAINTDIGIAASTSDVCVKFFELSTLQSKGQLKYHKDQITEIKARSNSLLSASKDGQIAIWDLRQALSATPALTFKTKDPVLSFDMSIDDTMLVSGLALDKNCCAKINLWDPRTVAQPIAVFENSHSEDVSQIRCHPSISHQFLSGSSDGLLCTFDASQTDEDEALLYVANTEASISGCGYFGPSAQYIYAHSDMETLQLWTNEATQLADFGDVRDLAESGVPIDYIIGCKYDSQKESLYLAAGTNEGDIHLLHVGAGSFEHVQALQSGHSGVVRGLNWDLGQGWAVSGAEDGRVSWWATTVPAQPPSPLVQAVSPTASSQKDKSASSRASNGNSRRFAPY